MTTVLVPTLNKNTQRFHAQRDIIKKETNKNFLNNLYQHIHAFTNYSEQWIPSVHLVEEDESFFYVEITGVDGLPSLYKMAQQVGYNTNTINITLDPTKDIWRFYYATNTHLITKQMYSVSSSELSSIVRQRYRQIAETKNEELVIDSPKFDTISIRQREVIIEIIYKLITTVQLKMDNVNASVSKVQKKPVAPHEETLVRLLNKEEGKTSERILSTFTIQLDGCTDIVPIYDITQQFQRFSYKSFKVVDFRYNKQNKSLLLDVEGHIREKRKNDIMSDEENSATEEEQKSMTHERKKRK